MISFMILDKYDIDSDIVNIKFWRLLCFSLALAGDKRKVYYVPTHLSAERSRYPISEKIL